MSKCNECKNYQFEANSQYWCEFKLSCAHSPETHRDYFEPKQWKPMHPINITYDFDGETIFADFDVEYLTKKQSEDLAKRLKQLATLYAWACDHNYLGGNWYTYVGVDGKWDTSADRIDELDPLVIYMTEEGAEATAKALNEGILKL